MKNTKPSHSNISIGSNLKLRLSAYVRRAGKTALLITALLGLTNSGFAQSSNTVSAGVFNTATATPPVAGLYDIIVTNFTSNVGPAGLNYYTDNATPPGQTFTTLGAAAQGYQLTDIYVKTDPGGGGNPGTDPYVLRVFSLTNAGAGTATLLTAYTTTNSTTVTVAQGNWIRISGLTNILATNRVYGFSLRNNNSKFWRLANSSASPNGPYTGGQSALFPTTATGTANFGSGSLSDAAFDVVLFPWGDPLVSPTTIAPANPVYAGTPVILSATFGGTAPFTSFVWQSDGASGGVTWTSLPGSTTNTYSLNTAALAAANYQYRLIVSGAAGTTTNSPSTLILSNASAPFVVANTTVTPSTAPVGSSVTMSATFGGTQPVYYQWLFTATNGTTSFVPGATANSLTLVSVQFTNAGSYSLIASNNPGGVPAMITNTPASLTVRPAVIISASSTAPTPGSDDIAQLSSTGDVKNPDTLNYYDNNGTKPGQTFTTGSNPNGYTLNALYYLAGGPVINDGNHPAAVVYTLRIYSISGTAATLVSTYVNDNISPAIPNNTWVKWTGGLTNAFAPNSVYAYSISSGAGFMHIGSASNNPSFYSGGELALLPTASGTATLGASHNTDAAFLVNLVQTGLPAIQTVDISPANSPANPVYGGQLVTLNVGAIGAAPLVYNWQTDNALGGTFSDIAGSNTNSFNIDTTLMAAGAYNYDVIVTNSSGSATSSVVTLNLLAASPPVVTTNTIITPSGVFAGNSVSMRAAFSGTPAIAYQWMFDNGSGAVAVAGATNTTYVIPSATIAYTGNYFLQASNGIAPYTNASTPALLTVSPVPQTNTTSAAILDGGNVAPPVQTYDIAQLISAPPSIVPGLNYYVDNNAPPGQTFTTSNTPPTVAGYPLVSIWMQAELSTIGSGGNSPQNYTLGIYQVTGTNVSLLTSYVSTNTFSITDGNWVQWIGLTNVLRTNSTYAFSLKRNSTGWWKLANNSTATDLYDQGQSVSLPASGTGALLFSSDATIDAAFLVNLTPPAAPVVIQDTMITPANCYAGNPVAMSAFFSGSTPLRYQWWFTDTNGAGPVLISGATNNTYNIASVTHANAGTYSCVASNNAGGVPSVANSTPAVLTVPVPPQTFVADFAFLSGYGGPGVIGDGSFWNRIDGTGGSTSGLADDGSTDLYLGFTSTRTWDFANNNGGIPLFGNYMLNQGTDQTRFGLKNLPNGLYYLVLYACNGHYQYSQTTFNIGSASQTAICTNDTTFIPNNNYVVFTNLVVTNGTINGTWQKVAAEAALNGAQIFLGYAFENPTVSIFGQPISLVVTQGNLAVFGVNAVGQPPLHYQWHTNGITVAGATNSTYTIAAAAMADGIPTYDVTISDTLGHSTNSAAASLTVVIGVNTTPANIVSVVSGTDLVLSWPADHTGWRLQIQTNFTSVGLNTNWVDVPGSTTANSVTNTINQANGSVFYRMIYP